jgi:3'-phosphoadenosine 5'-phosphosulfate sulfotransferase (PAPS reductase)/FAD synthetase
MFINKTLKQLIISHYGYNFFLSISDFDKRKIYGYQGHPELFDLIKKAKNKKIHIQTYYQVATDKNKSLLGTLSFDKSFVSLHFISFFDACDLPIYLDITYEELRKDYTSKKCIESILNNLGIDLYTILYKYEYKEQNIKNITEELIKKTWHPNRMFKWCLDIDEQKDLC